MAGGDRRSADAVLVAALAAGATVQDAASRAKVSERTVYRRLDDPAFRRQVATVRAEMLDRATGRLSEAATAAVLRLRTLLSASTESVQLGAARAILEHAVKLREATALEQRIAALEEQAAARETEEKVKQWVRPA